MTTSLREPDSKLWAVCIGRYCGNVKPAAEGNQAVMENVEIVVLGMSKACRHGSVSGLHLVAVSLEMHICCRVGLCNCALPMSFKAAWAARRRSWQWCNADEDNKDADGCGVSSGDEEDV
eukprot:CAMPEP_0172895652 /NCGR_PEP_ID=MMETSP1075-20121228/153566_1 /TAXON_ID=2916 /ORGANISM="Ceratium fusus, Strain PA161109" /LENGTH=119 /DNA_ID=CAMNT_0013750905 /DNA_START=119 /DNA_END=478 /DNA_ORIENTATION=+